MDNFYYQEVWLASTEAWGVNLVYSADLQYKLYPGCVKVDKSESQLSAFREASQFRKWLIKTDCFATYNLK